MQGPIDSHQLPNSASEPGLRFEYIDHPNPYNYQVAHRHDYYEILLFTSGAGGRQLIDFVEYEIGANCLYMVTPGQVHLVQRKPSENGVLLQFSAEFLSQCIHTFDADWNYHLRACPMLRLTPEQASTMNDAMVEVANLLKQDSTLAHHKLRHRFALCFLEIIELVSEPVELARSADTSMRFIREAEQNFHHQRSVAAYADGLGVPVKKLTTEVKKRYGKSPLQILHELLFVEIKRMLRVDGLTHKEISYRLQFDDQSSYTRFVRKMGDVTPTQLKQQLSDDAHR